MKLKKRIIISFLFCFLAIFFISCINASKQEVIDELKRGDYQQVLEDIHGLSTNEKLQVQQVAVDKIPEIVAQAENKQITYSQAVDELNFIQKIIPKSEEFKVTKAIDYIKNLDYQNTVNK